MLLVIRVQLPPDNMVKNENFLRAGVLLQYVLHLGIVNRLDLLFVDKLGVLHHAGELDPLESSDVETKRVLPASHVVDDDGMGILDDVMRWHARGGLPTDITVRDLILWLMVVERRVDIPRSGCFNAHEIRQS